MSSAAACYAGVTSDRGGSTLAPALQSLRALQYNVAGKVHAFGNGSCVRAFARRACVRRSGGIAASLSCPPALPGLLIVKGTNQEREVSGPTTTASIARRRVLALLASAPFAASVCAHRWSFVRDVCDRCGITRLDYERSR